MILTGSEIKKNIVSGKVKVFPYEDKMLNPNSYNYHLGPVLKVPSAEVMDPGHHHEFETIEIPSEGYVLMPGILYLGHTFEVIGSECFVINLIGRSSLGRLGLFLQITADLGQLGKAHSWTLEMKVVQPLRIYPMMRIGQVSFWQASGDIDFLYQSGYAEFNTPRQSKFHEELII